MRLQLVHTTYIRPNFQEKKSLESSTRKFLKQDFRCRYNGWAHRVVVLPYEQPGAAAAVADVAAAAAVGAGAAAVAGGAPRPVAHPHPRCRAWCSDSGCNIIHHHVRLKNSVSDPDQKCFGAPVSISKETEKLIFFNAWNFSSLPV